MDMFWVGKQLEPLHSLLLVVHSPVQPVARANTRMQMRAHACTHTTHTRAYMLW